MKTTTITTFVSLTNFAHSSSSFTPTTSRTQPRPNSCYSNHKPTRVTCVLTRRSALFQIAATAVATTAFQFPHHVNAEQQQSTGVSANDEMNANETIDPCKDKPPVSDIVELWIRVGTSPARRVELSLFGNVVPKTVDNFKQLVINGDYNETSIYRIVPSLTIQMGDVLHNQGMSGKSATGELLNAENFRISHSCPGIVSMAKTRDGKIDSRFFITTRDGDSFYLDGKYVAFGLVTNGFEYLVELDRFAGSKNKPKLPVFIERASLISSVPLDLPILSNQTV